MIFRGEIVEVATFRASPEPPEGPDDWDEAEAEAAELQERVRNRELPESALRTFGVSSSVAAVDKQGRITLDEQSRKHAGLTTGGQAIVAGAIRMLEVWRPSRYHTIRNEDGIVQPSRVWLDEGDET